MEESATNPSNDGALIRLYKFWWIKLPILVSRLSNGFAQAMMDGYYLTVWRGAAAVLPGLLFLLGFLWGWQDWGVDHVFTESRLMIIFIIILGSLNGNLGTLFFFGFVSGDFLLDSHVIGGNNISDKWLITQFLLIKIPLIIKYSLLWMILIFMPKTTKSLILQFTPPDKIGLRASLIVGSLLNIFLTAIFIYYWTQIAPFIIRPLFTWQNASLNFQTFTYLQNETALLVSIGVLAVTARMILQNLTVFNPQFKEKIDLYESDIEAENPEIKEPLIEKINPWIRVIFLSLWILLLMSGLFEAWFEAIILGILIFAVYAVQRNLIPLPIDGWRNLINKVPLIVRLGIILILIYFLNNFIVLQTWETGSSSFRPLVITAGLTMLIFFIFIPGTPKEETARQ